MRLASFLPALAVAVALAAAAAARAQVPQVAERVEVSRVVVDLHVLADDGRPITGLAAGDLQVSVDGKPVKIESLKWTAGAVALGEAASPLTAPDLAVGPPGHRPGRLALLLFQKDLEPSRMEGLMIMLRQAEGLVAGLGPDDRVAVASFEHHLELWSDFTTDRAAVRAILTRSILFAGRAGELVTGDDSLLARTFDREAGRRAASMEQALVVVGDALDRLPGSKTVVIVGHGFGRMIGGGGLATARVVYEPEYREARTPALARPRHGILPGCDPRGFPHARDGTDERGGGHRRVLHADELVPGPGRCAARRGPRRALRAELREAGPAARRACHPHRTGRPEGRRLRAAHVCGVGHTDHD